MSQWPSSVQMAFSGRGCDMSETVLPYTRKVWPLTLAGVVGGQVADEGGDAVRVQVLHAVAAVAGQGGYAAPGADFGGGFGDRANHAGGGPGRDGVGGYAVAAHVLGDDFGEAGDAALGRAVVGLAAVADQAGLTAESDDPAGTLLAEQDAGVLDHGEKCP